jgi:hypothetical protein
VTLDSRPHDPRRRRTSDFAAPYAVDLADDSSIQRRHSDPASGGTGIAPLLGSPSWRVQNVRASFDPFELGRVEVKIGEPEMSCLLIELIGPADLNEE